MDWIITTVFLSVLTTSLCFNINPAAWKILTNPAAGFGYQVVQRSSGLLVSAPLAQNSAGGKGQIYKCTTGSCRLLSVPREVSALKLSLGLKMTSDPDNDKTLACGPTIPKDCRIITMFNGLCFEINGSYQVGLPTPSSREECPPGPDIAFLLDGSGSVWSGDFKKMKTFVKNLISSIAGQFSISQFSITQFSTYPYTHYYFNTFDANNYENLIENIRQRGGATYTASAIRHVVDNVFSSYRGSRPNAKKVLIVITDGQSHDRGSLPATMNLAEAKNIIRFAIGVGHAFTYTSAKWELNTIASSPTANHVFQVQGFGALDAIRQNLQDKIFSIEGSKTGGAELEMEMSQEGFSAAYVPGGIQLGIVGANQWKGGYTQYQSTVKTSFEPENMKPDSYLGYSMAVAKTAQGPLTILGAPRYDHRGVVIVAYRNSILKMINPFPWQFQSGEYFGAEVCTMTVDVRGAYTDLVLISAPLYVDRDREGRVYICTVTRSNVECHLDSPRVLRGVASEKGRFGSSLAALPDLNSDGFRDLAIGAPLENHGEGSIYIFHGEGGKGGINTDYSQRISGSEVRSGLKFFGMSISQSSLDLSEDGLPDLAVGSQGTVVLLRSKPIVMVGTTVTFSPNQISTQSTDCSQPLANTALICFTMTAKHSTIRSAQAKINYTLTLDATRKAPNNRAYIIEKQREYSGRINATLGESQCIPVNFSVKACPEDSLNALDNELRFTFEGVPLNNGLRPSLAQQAQPTSFYPLTFEINCGTDNNCVDNLKVDFNFTESLEVKVGIDELLNVTVSVENSEENSYNSRVILTYPAGLSYRKFSILQGRIVCSSIDREDVSLRGKTECTIDKPIFKSNTTALFIVSYGIETNSQLDRTISVTANATSGNEQHSSSSKLYKSKEIDVKYSIFVTIASTLSYTNFTFGQNDLQKPVRQSVTVSNDIRAMNFTVVIRVPVKLGARDIWVDAESLFPSCIPDQDQEPPVTNFVAQIQKNKVVDCSVARCRVFRCTRFMGRLESKKYEISANLSSGWIEQIGLGTAKFLLTSTASLEYDKDQYIFFSTGSSNNPPESKIEAEVEVFPEPDFTKEIVGGCLGGLALLALITAGLYKAGFFKSKYSQMMKEDAGQAGQAGDPGTDGDPPTLE